jgi:hypothetical protein
MQNLSSDDAAGALGCSQADNAEMFSQILQFTPGQGAFTDEPGVASSLQTFRAPKTNPFAIAEELKTINAEAKRRGFTTSCTVYRGHQPAYAEKAAQGAFNAKESMDNLLFDLGAAATESGLLQFRLRPVRRSNILIIGRERNPALHLRQNIFVTFFQNLIRNKEFAKIGFSCMLLVNPSDDTHSGFLLDYFKDIAQKNGAFSIADDSEQVLNVLVDLRQEIERRKCDPTARKPVFVMIPWLDEELFVDSGSEDEGELSREKLLKHAIEFGASYGVYILLGAEIEEDLEFLDQRMFAHTFFVSLDTGLYTAGYEDMPDNLSEHHAAYVTNRQAAVFSPFIWN